MKRMIVIHCSATPPTMDIGAKEIRQWHVDGNGWADIGYHMVIRRNGVLEYGRHLGRSPAAQAGFNRGTIAICLVGGVDRNNKPVNNFTSAQTDMLKNEINLLRGEHDIVSIVGHRDFPHVHKDCPCFSVTDWVYRNIVRSG